MNKKKIPYITSSNIYAGNIAGLTAEEFFFDVEKSFWAQKHCIDLHGCSGSPGFDLPGWTGCDFGSQIDFGHSHKVTIPKFKRYAVSSLDEAYNLKLPVLDECFAFNKRLDFYRLARQHGYMASLPAGSPLEVLGHITEPSFIFRWIRKEPKAIHHLLGLATDYLLEVCHRYIEAFGSENCSAFSCYPMESNDLTSPKSVKEYSLPYMKKIHETLMAHGVTQFGIHLCGDHRYNLEFFKELSLPKGSFISVSEKMDILHVADSLGHDHVYGGNVPTALLKSGTYDKVYAYAHQLIKRVMEADLNFYLMPSCDLPPDTPPINLHAMGAAARNFYQDI